MTHLAWICVTRVNKKIKKGGFVTNSPFCCPTLSHSATCMAWTAIFSNLTTFAEWRTSPKCCVIVHVMSGGTVCALLCCWWVLVLSDLAVYQTIISRSHPCSFIMGTHITRAAICVFRQSICVFWACHVNKLVLRRGHIICLVAIQARVVANVDATGVWHAVYGTTPAIHVCMCMCMHKCA